MTCADLLNQTRSVVRRRHESCKAQSLILLETFGTLTQKGKGGPAADRLKKSPLTSPDTAFMVGRGAQSPYAKQKKREGEEGDNQLEQQHG